MKVALSASLSHSHGNSGGRTPGMLPKPLRLENNLRQSSERPIRQMATPVTSTVPQYSSRASLKIAVVGDVHEQWDDDSAATLASLGADVALFVGDFGNEDVEIIKRISELKSPQRRLVQLGNHDSWYSLTPRGRQRAVRVALMSSSLRNLTDAPGDTDAVDKMLNLLGPSHIGYSSMAYSDLGVCFVGGRPFSKGGKRWDDVAAFYQQKYGIGSMEESAHRIVDEALSQDPELALIVVGHNGPTGLGNQRHSMCGVDWQLPEEDFGDPDLGEALDTIAAQGRPASLVLFGHMHHALKGGGRRDMAYVDSTTGTVYLNSAVVPRIKKFGNGVRGHHFLLVDIQDGAVAAARHIWASGEEDGKPIILAAEEVIKVAAAGDGSQRKVVSYYKANTDEWVPVVLPALATSTTAAAEQELATTTAL